MNYTALLLGLAQIMSPLTGTGEIQNMQAQAEVVEIAADDPVYIPGWTYGEEPAEPVLEDGYDLVWVKFAPKTDALEEEWTEDVPSEAGKYIYLALVDDTQQGLEVEYSGEFEIEPKDLSGLEIHISPAASRDDLQILDGETILVLDKDYTVTEQGDFLEITFIGNYTGNTEIPLEKEIQAGWIEDEDGLKYVLEDGSYAAGWILINQDWYWFDENNVRYTGWLKDPNSGAWYWLDLDTGIMWHDAWLTDNGVKYYLGSTGSWIKDGWKKEGSSWKYVLGDGTCYNDGFHKINGLWYYFGNDGIMKTGWIKDVDNKEYFMDRKDGWMHKNEWIDGKYYVDNCGVWQQTRWVQNANGKWWLRYPDGTYPHNGFLDVNNKTYYFDSEGWMATGPVVDNNNTYYMLDSGEMAVNTTINGWYVNKLGYASSPEEAEIGRYCQKVYDQVGYDLYKCFWWVVDNTAYQSLPIPMEPAAGLTYQQNYALYGFNNHKGDCYCFASQFYYLAKNMGYDATFVMGRAYIPKYGKWFEHGWVEILEDGVNYIYDPEVQLEYKATSRNFYRIPEGSTVIEYHK